MSAHPRLMIYTQDSLGLGHLRRATNLANALVRRRADLSVLLVVDSPVAPFFELDPRVDFVKLPTVVKVDAGVFRTGRLLTSYELVNKLRANVIREILLRFLPHVLLVDHMPGGANRELIPALQAARRRRIPVRLVLGLRDIIDAPDVVRATWRRERVYHALERFYDQVLVYGSRAVFDAAAEYELNARARGGVVYCGYVCNMDEVKPAERIRGKLGLDGEPIVAVMAGGGADAFALMDTYLEAARRLGASRRFASVVVTGPFMPEEQRKVLRDRAKARGVHLRSTVGDVLSHINAADTVVCMAGYNTVTEVLRFSKPAVLVPRPGPSAEQTMRASLFERRGLARMVHHAALSPGKLAEAIECALDEPQAPTCRLDLGGVDTAADALLQGLPAPVDAPVHRPAPARLGPGLPPGFLPAAGTVRSF